MPNTAIKLSNPRRQLAAWFYSWLTWRQRRRLKQQFAEAERFPIAVLFYHRVADRHLTPWTISRRNFAQHLDWLEKHFEIISLSDAQQRIRGTNNKRPSVAITFDDGYSENCDFAIPELLRRGLPATYFVVSEAVATGKPFAHDSANLIPLKPNTIDEIKDIHRSGIEIGGHTRRHADIGRITNRSELEDEVLGGIAHLESWGVGPVRYFSFPFGMPQNTSQLAIDLLCKAGVAGFCTAYGAWNWPGSSGYHLRRIHADPGMQTLKSWLTFDPRKLIDHWQLPFKEPVYTKPAPSAQQLLTV